MKQTEPEKIRRAILSGFYRLDANQQLQMLAEVCIAFNYTECAAWCLGQLAERISKKVVQ